MADDVRQRLALALDVDDLDTARRMAGMLAPWSCTSMVAAVPKLSTCVITSPGWK